MYKIMRSHITNHIHLLCIGILFLVTYIDIMSVAVCWCWRCWRFAFAQRFCRYSVIISTTFATSSWLHLWILCVTELNNMLVLIWQQPKCVSTGKTYWVALWKLLTANSRRFLAEMSHDDMFLFIVGFHFHCNRVVQQFAANTRSLQTLA